MSRHVTRPRAAVLAAGAGAAAALLMAPPVASADVAPGSVAIEPGLNIRVGTADYGTTCPYKVTAKATENAETVEFFSRPDPGGAWTKFGTDTSTAVNDTVEATWTPNATGKFVVNANDVGAGGGVSAAPVTVGNGFNVFGVACIVF
ncbi:hypothetical protein ACFWPA_18330 [Rhodococcus sp. NPDC058505]|uniref:hypothetical protein n=1 Tax=unclassified Rhodococcus (in: high G+C Gram-positive bacteria) TaxID=192944 RepID=UPI003658C285